MTVLVTSRAPLRLSGEHEVAILPLTLPAATQNTPDAIQASDAVRLFLARARAIQPDLQVTEANFAAIAEICCRLDGLPLAIELAAARMRIFTPHALRARLAADGSLPLLTHGACDMPARQQTIRQTISWSYDLLSRGEQRMFARLGIFVGGWSQEAARAITANTELSRQADACLEALVAHSLVQVTADVDEEPRFGMLETVREFALAQLVASGERATVRRAYARFVLGLAERAEPELRAHDQIRWLDRIEQELDNVRAALAWGVEVSDLEFVARLVTTLESYWELRDRE